MENLSGHKFDVDCRKVSEPDVGNNKNMLVAVHDCTKAPLEMVENKLWPVKVSKNRERCQF